MANETTTAGPACSFASMPVSVKMPVPMTIPMPKPMRSTGPSCLRSRGRSATSGPSPWWRTSSTLFVRNRVLATARPYPWSAG
jgi:hypothetical protein